VTDPPTRRATTVVPAAGVRVVPAPGPARIAAPPVSPERVDRTWDATGRLATQATQLAQAPQLAQVLTG
jgi:hypothetical protein